MKILHTADAHASYRQYGRVEREQDFYAVLSEIERIATATASELVILAGDTFDSLKPSAEAVERVQTLVANLKSKGIAVVGIAGNHDAVNDDWLTVCGITSVDGKPYTCRDGTVIYGQHFHRPSVFLETLADDAENVKCDIYVMHQPVKELCNYGGEDLSVDQLLPHMKAMGVKYVAMGDIHQYAAACYDGVWFSYPGSPERCSADDLGIRSVNLIDINGGKITLSTAAVTTRPFVKIKIESEDMLTTLLEQLKDKPVVVLTYLPEHRDLAKRAEALMKTANIICRTYPLSKTSTVGTEVVALAVNDFSKAEVGDMLKLGITGYFAPGSDEYELVIQLIGGADINAVVDAFMGRKLKQGQNETDQSGIPQLQAAP